jgi:hypothetical protein
VVTGIGDLEFPAVYPTRETEEKLRDHLDYLHGVETAHRATFAAKPWRSTMIEAEGEG